MKNRKSCGSIAKKVWKHEEDNELIGTAKRNRATGTPHHSIQQHTPMKAFALVAATLVASASARGGGGGRPLCAQTEIHCTVACVPSDGSAVHSTPMEAIESANCHQAGINETETCFECHDGVDNDGDGACLSRSPSHEPATATAPRVSRVCVAHRHLRLRRPRLCYPPDLRREGGPRPPRWRRSRRDRRARRERRAR